MLESIGGILKWLFSGIGITVLSCYMKGRFNRIRIGRLFDPNSGIIGFYPKLPTDEIAKEFEDAKDKIIILQSWMDNQESLKDTFSGAVKNGCEIKILLLDKDSESLKMRASEYEAGININDAKERLRTHKESLISACKKLQNNNKIEIKEYDSLLVVSLYGYDDYIYIGMFWRGDSAIRCPQIKVKKDGYFGKCAINHFNEIWDDNKSIPIYKS